MATTRIHWEDLPGLVQSRVHAHVGDVIKAETVPEGYNSEIAAILHAANGTRYFVKGLRSGHPRVWTQDREAGINAHAAPIAPRLLWTVQTDDWHLLGFEAIDGRHASYAPGSPDLALLAAALTELGRRRCPDLTVKEAPQRWAAYADGQEALFAGETLLHTDWNPANVLITPGSARVVDWAWPTRGAAWIDPACWVVWLIAAGHHPAQAEEWAARAATWRTAPADALTRFALVQARLWESIRNQSTDPWTTSLARASARWAAHRGV